MRHMHGGAWRSQHEDQACHALAAAVVEALPDLAAWQQAQQRSSSSAPGPTGGAATGLDTPDNTHTRMAAGSLVAATLGVLSRGQQAQRAQQPGALAAQPVSQAAAEAVLQAVEEGAMLAALAGVRALEGAQAKLASSGLADASGLPPGMQDISGAVCSLACYSIVRSCVQVKLYSWMCEHFLNISIQSTNDIQK